MLDRLKDDSIVYSFDRTGYQRHARQFSEIDDRPLARQRVLITGGTSGIGAALAKRLAGAGAQVWVTGRGRDKFDDSALAERGVQFIELDMTRFDRVVSQPLPELDALVCNAGGMPDKLTLVEDRYDVIFASQVIGHYLLIRRCIEQSLLPAGAPVHLTAGEFWFDRKPRKLYPFFWTKESADTRQSLLDLCEDTWQRHRPTGG